MPQLSGIFPALVTPFDAEEHFAPSALERLLERLYDQAIHGVYVCGHTGEGLPQPLKQRKQVTEIAVQASPPGKSVIVHVGASRTADAIELARHSARAGAHALSSLPPLGGYSFPELRAYYQALAGASDLPLLIYYFPDLCPAINSAEQILELCALPNVVGLKYTDLNLYVMNVLKKTVPVIFNGRDEVLVAGLLMGADGGIGTFYNLVPELFVQLYDSTKAQKWSEARAVQERINELISITLRFPLLPAVKAMLTWSGIDCGPCLAPRGSMTKEQESELRRQLTTSSFADAPFAGRAAE